MTQVQTQKLERKIDQLGSKVDYILNMLSKNANLDIKAIHKEELSLDEKEAIKEAWEDMVNGNLESASSVFKELNL